MIEAADPEPFRVPRRDGVFAGYTNEQLREAALGVIDPKRAAHLAAHMLSAIRAREPMTNHATMAAAFATVLAHEGFEGPQIDVIGAMMSALADPVAREFTPGAEFFPRVVAEARHG